MMSMYKFAGAVRRVVQPDAITRLTIRRRDRPRDIIHEYEHAA